MIKLNDRNEIIISQIDAVIAKLNDTHATTKRQITAALRNIDTAIRKP